MDIRFIRDTQKNLRGFVVCSPVPVFRLAIKIMRILIVVMRCCWCSVSDSLSPGSSCDVVVEYDNNQNLAAVALMINKRYYLLFIYWPQHITIIIRWRAAPAGGCFINSVMDQPAGVVWLWSCTETWWWLVGCTQSVSHSLAGWSLIKENYISSKN